MVHMQLIKIGIILVFGPFWINLLSADTITIQPLNPIINVKPKSDAYSIINITIPSGVYIYANPKGEGIGKPLVAEAFTEHPIEVHNPRYLPGMQYISPLDDKPVFIYRDATSICIPFTVTTSQEGLYSITITVDALSCDDISCTPIKKTITQKIRVTNNAADFPVSAINQYKEPHEISHAGQSDDLVFHTIDIHSAPVSFYYALIFGIIGGFLLNFMPCVLPVISLKIFSFVSYAQNNPRKIKILGLLFVSGILTTFVFLASLAAFAGYNWGQLFQHPSFILIMASVIFALALSFFGIYTLNAPSLPSTLQSANPYVDSYFKGIIATILATPCSGPFLGAALAWTLIQHPAVIFLIFMSTGIGMSLPYIFLAVKPGLVRYIPKPGEWMIYFEQFMGFLLAATSIFLITLLDAPQLSQALWFLLLLAVGLWQWGKFGNLSRPVTHRILSFIVLCAIIITSGFTLFSAKTAQNGIPYKALDWGAIVHDKSSMSMVIFTADWCLNCKFVEATTLRSDEVIDFIQTNNVRVYKADITEKNPEAENLMHALGARSIPFLAIFPGGEQFYSPFIIRDMYTADELLDALNKAYKAGGTLYIPPLLDIPRK